MLYDSTGRNMAAVVLGMQHKPKFDAWVGQYGRSVESDNFVAYGFHITVVDIEHTANVCLVDAYLFDILPNKAFSNPRAANLCLDNDWEAIVSFEDFDICFFGFSLT